MSDYPTRPGYKAEGTSREAAESMNDFAPTLRNRVLEFIKARGAIGSTSDECAEAMGESVLSVRPRFAELHKAGNIRATKLRKANESGREATIFVWAGLYANR